MSEALERTGAQAVLLIPDDDSNITLNSSTAGDDGIALTDFTFHLWEDGEYIGTNATLTAGPYNLTVDNVSSTSPAQGAYKVNLSLPNRSKWIFLATHTTAMVTNRIEELDTLSRDELGSTSRGNTKLVFRTASTDIAGQNASAGVLSEMDVITRYAGDADFSSPKETVTFKFFYQAFGETNPIRVSLV